MNFFDHYLHNFFRNSNDSLLNDRNFDFSINNLLNFFDFLNDDIVNFLDFFDLNDWNKFLSDNFDFFNDSLNRSKRNWFFNNLCNLSERLDDSFNWHNLLNVDRNLLDYLTNDNLSLINNFVYFLYNNLLFNDFDFDKFGNFDNLLYNFFNIDWDLYNLFNDCFDCYNFLNYLDDFLDFRNNMMNWGLNLDNFSINNYSFNNLFDFHDFRNFNLVLNDFFFVCGYLNNFFSNGRNLNKLFNDIINNFDNFDWNMNDFLDFNEFRYFYNFFDVSFDWNNLRNLNNSFDDSFDNLLYFNDLGNNSKDLEDIVN